MSKITTSKLNSLPQQVEENRKNINILGSEIDTANTNISSLTTRTTSLEGKFPVNTSDIKDSAITSVKIASNAITTDKVANGAITKDKIASGVLPASCLNTFIGKFDCLCGDGAIRTCSFICKTGQATMSTYSESIPDFISTTLQVLEENGFNSDADSSLTCWGFDSISIGYYEGNRLVYKYQTPDSGGVVEFTPGSYEYMLNCSYIILACK